MSVSLAKGANISLSKAEPGLSRILVGLGWDILATHGNDFDLDASAFLLGATGKVRGDDDFVFYNHLKAADGSVEHTGDNRTGEGDGDDEALAIDLAALPAAISKVAIAVTIHDGEAQAQNFGMVSNAFIRVVNSATDREIARYDLTEDCSVETALIFGEVYRHNDEWKFRAVGQGYQGGLAPLARGYGVDVA